MNDPVVDNNSRIGRGVLLERLHVELNRQLPAFSPAMFPGRDSGATAGEQELGQTTNRQSWRASVYSMFKPHRLSRIPVIGRILLWIWSALQLQNTRTRVHQAQMAIELLQSDQKDEIKELDAKINDVNQKITFMSKSIDLLTQKLLFQQISIDNLSYKSNASSYSEEFSRKDFIVPDIYNENMDLLFQKLSEEFRGTREDIKERVKIYVERVCLAGAGSPERPVLDIGCGRGEWLEVLREQGISGRGVDLNRSNVRMCQEMGLEAAHGEAVATLRRYPKGSLGGVTAIHVIEHIPFDALVMLLDEALRALASGGILILETPNPENLMVIRNFFLDPTHHHPIPPHLLSFVVRQRGFTDVEVVRLHPYSPRERLDDQSGPAERLLNELLFGSQDYAIVARRP